MKNCLSCEYKHLVNLLMMSVLKLKSHAFQGNALSREQLKKVLGGVTGSGGTCAVLNDDGGTSHGLSKQEAIDAANAQGTHWCCDSCNKASWFCPTGEFC